MKFAFAMVLALGTILPSAARAEIFAVVNPSFEIHGLNLSNDCTTGLGECKYSSDGVIPGWNTTALPAPISGQVFKIQNFPGSGGNPPATNGDYIAYSEGPSIWQDVGTVVAGGTYTLSVDILHRIDAGFQGSIQFVLGGGGLGGTVVGTLNPYSDPGAGAWTTLTDVYTAGLLDEGQTLTVVLNSGGSQGNYDNVNLTGTPEPGTLALFGSALACLGLLRRKRVA